jgi:hypothetical protein
MELIDAVALVLYAYEDDEFDRSDRNVKLTLDEAYQVIKSHRREFLAKLPKDKT